MKGALVFASMRDKLEKLRDCSDSSEHKHNIEFLQDLNDSIAHDRASGNYAAQEKQVLKTSMLGSIAELRESLTALETFVCKELK